MPVYIKKRGPKGLAVYDLNEPFVAGGGIYTKETAEALQLWARMTPTGPDDLSNNSISLGYTAPPLAFSNQQIPNKEISRIIDIPVVRFRPGVSSAQTAPSPQLAFGQPVPSVGSDKPFTVATWVRFLPGPPYSYIFGCPNDISTNYATELGVYPGTATGDWLVAFAVQDTVNGGGHSYVASNTTGPHNKSHLIPMHTWHHIAVSYSGDPGPLPSSAQIYINGNLLNTSHALIGTYVGMNTSLTPSWNIGANWNSAVELEGFMAEFGIWNVALSAENIKALYHSTAGAYTAQSGILSLPNRVRLRDEDDVRGEYPNHLRTTGARGPLKGNKTVTFNDTVTQTFLEQTGSIWPLVQNEENLKNADLSYLIPSPNQNSNMASGSIAGRANPFLSAQGIKEVVDTGINFTPFNDSNIFLLDKSDAFYMSGTTAKDYPGFGSPLRDKIIIKLPINNSSEKYITRYSRNGVPSNYTDSSGNSISNIGLFPFGFYSTGFYYYNFSGNQWEDKGLDSNYYMMYSGSSNSMNANTVRLGGTIAPENSAWTWSSPYTPFPKVQQFKMSDHMGVFVDSVADIHAGTRADPASVLTSSLGYDKIGCPTQSGLAPYHSQYHATASQVFSLSEYLGSDFLLEKAVIEIPVTVQRMRGDSHGELPARFYESCRDIDNYVFFLYRQTRDESNPADSTNHVNTSRRTLVASGSAAFYNSYAFSGKVVDHIKSHGLPHTPSFSHDFNYKVNAYPDPSKNPAIIQAFSGTIRIEMQAAVPNGQPVGGTRFPVLGDLKGSGTSNTGFLNPTQRSVITQDWWQGGDQIPSSSLTANSTINTVVSNEDVFIAGDQLAAGLVPFALTSSNKAPSYIRDTMKSVGSDSVVRDPRQFKTYLGAGKFNIDGDDLHSLQDSDGTINSNLSSIGMLGYTGHDWGISGTPSYPILFGARPSSEVSPYLFQPGDELILGIDAGISMLPCSSSGLAGGGPGTMTNYIGRATPVDAGRDLGFYRSLSPMEILGCMSGSFMKILTGSASLTLFGSQVKLNSEVLVTTNQGLTSNAIHEAIGTRRVLDQFDIASRLDLSGSYVDNFVYGKLNVSQNALNFSNSVPLAEPSFNRINTDAGFRTARSVVSLHSKNRRGIDGASTNPSVISSPTADNKVGSPASFIGDDDNDFVIWNRNIKELAGDPHFVTKKTSAVMGASNIVSLQRFVSFPDMIETYYDSMAPDVVDFAERDQTNFIRAWKISSGTFTHRIYADVANLHRVTAYPYKGNPDRYTHQNFYLRLIPSSGSFSSTRVKEVLSTDYSKLSYVTLFNRGFSYRAKIGPTNMNEFSYNITGSFGPRYGMISPVLAKPVAKFRRDRFGQIRDMLEQRPYGKFFLSVAGGRNAAIDESPIQVKFVSSLNGSTTVSPFATDSANFSFEYTSSYPYSDRSSADPLLVSSELVTMVPGIPVVTAPGTFTSSTSSSTSSAISASPALIGSGFTYGGATFTPGSGGSSGTTMTPPTGPEPTISPYMTGPVLFGPWTPGP